MIPEDDFLLTKPARKETVTAVRIALIALMGCLLLMAVLMIQARAEPDAVLHRQIKTVNQIERHNVLMAKPASQIEAVSPQ